MFSRVLCMKCVYGMLVILKALKHAGSNNPVMLLDEVDKMGSGIRGDPAAALLEVCNMYGTP